MTNNWESGALLVAPGFGITVLSLRKYRRLCLDKARMCNETCIFQRLQPKTTWFSRLKLLSNHASSVVFSMILLIRNFYSSWEINNEAEVAHLEEADSTVQTACTFDWRHFPREKKARQVLIRGGPYWLAEVCFLPRLRMHSTTSALVLYVLLLA